MLNESILLNFIFCKNVYVKDMNFEKETEKAQHFNF